MKSKVQKGLTIAMLALIICCMLIVSAAISVGAEEKNVSAESVSFTMVKGAGVRYGGQDGHNGLRFTAQMPVVDYEALESNPTYEAVNYGILIAPADYHKSEPLTKAFEPNSSYAWAEWNNETGEWLYDEVENEGKTRIINLKAEEMTHSSEDADTMILQGAITDILPENIAREFVGIGYIETVSDGSFSYRFAEENDNVRSIAYIAQCAVADTGETAPDEAQKTWLQQNYIDTVSDVESEYKVEYYAETFGGEYEKIDTETYYSTIGAAVDYTPREMNGFIYDEENPLSKTGDKVLANDKLLIKRYYNLFSSWNVTSESALKDTRLNVYTTDIKTDDNVSVVTLSDIDGKSGRFYKVETVNGSNQERFQFKLLPSYEKSYYETLGNDYILSFDFRFSVENYTEPRVFHTILLGNTSPDENILSETWNTARIPISVVLENWENMMEVDNSAKDALITITTGRAWPGKVTLYIGNFQVLPGTVEKIEKPNTVLIDVSTTSEYKLTANLTEEEKSSLAEYGAKGTIVWSLTDYFGVKTVLGFSDMVETEKIELRAYDVTAEWRNGVVLYEGEIDFYDSSAPLVWNNEYNVDHALYFINNANRQIDGAIEVVSLSEQDPIGNKTEGEYFKVTPDKELILQYHIFQLRPIHSKAYYELYQNEGYSLTFDVYFEFLNEEIDPTNKLFYDNDGSFAEAQNIVLPNTWTTMSDTLDRLLVFFDQFFEPTNTSDAAYREMGIVGYDGGSFSNSEQVVFYIGNFAFEKAE